MGPGLGWGQKVDTPLAEKLLAMFKSYICLT